MFLVHFFPCTQNKHYAYSVFFQSFRKSDFLQFVILMSIFILILKLVRKMFGGGIMASLSCKE